MRRSRPVAISRPLLLTHARPSIPHNDFIALGVVPTFMFLTKDTKEDNTDASSLAVLLGDKNELPILFMGIWGKKNLGFVDVDKWIRPHAKIFKHLFHGQDGILSVVQYNMTSCTKRQWSSLGSSLPQTDDIVIPTSTSDKARLIGADNAIHQRPDHVN
ncbi:hypothetical protein ACH5RR_029272 [Cinchona calisaya]|uniref:Uncharacterized protein n=1 Tax=Cinchona calisaya TaxID=153742 RepID=A0ABD2YR62_9GENT